MEETPPHIPDVPRNTDSNCRTPILVKQSDQSPQNPIHPDRLQVPKPFKYPERYASPTDSIMSPVTKGILARSRKGALLLPPSKNQLKVVDLKP